MNGLSGIKIALLLVSYCFPPVMLIPQLLRQSFKAKAQTGSHRGTDWYKYKYVFIYVSSYFDVKKKLHIATLINTDKEQCHDTCHFCHCNFIYPLSEFLSILL